MARRPTTFGQRKTISQGLAVTRPVKYDVAKVDGELNGISDNEAATPDVFQGKKKKTLVKSRAKGKKHRKTRLTKEFLLIKDQVTTAIMDQIDASEIAKLTREEMVQEIEVIIAEVVGDLKIILSQTEQISLVKSILDEMLGLGPLEPLLHQADVTDILVNGAKQVYVERNGKLELTDVTFRNNEQVMNLASRIVSQVGRRIDRSTPLVDARLEDGSRVNVIVPPLAIKGPVISIRKFSKMPILLENMVDNGNLSENMAMVLRIASACRLNVVVSGGTGSGKTTLLNALSRLIDVNERIVTVEDSAELQLQQPHVVSLETRPANLEGKGEISIRDLVRNALRMRPDRIILGEIRGVEALDMLQAMNTGHDGSMSTLHANRARDALTRLENMVIMGSVNLPIKAIRSQIAEAIDMIIQIARMRDGIRRIVSISEVVGMEGEIISMQELFKYEYEGEAEDGRLLGTFKSSNLRPHMLEKARYFGLDKSLMTAMQ